MRDTTASFSFHAEQADQRNSIWPGDIIALLPRSFGGGLYIAADGETPTEHRAIKNRGDDRLLWAYARREGKDVAHRQSLLIEKYGGVSLFF